MKKMKKIETNTSKKPMKRLIALWVVFVMLIVPFANHVGKNDVKAEETGTVNVSTGQEQTVEDFIQIFPKTDEDGNVVKDDHSKTVHLLAVAQTYTTRIDRLVYDGVNNFEYGYVVCYDGKVPASEIEIDKIIPLTSDITKLSIDKSCTYYIYAKKTNESSYKLQYKLTVQFHDTAFSSDSQISGYVSSIEVNAGISDSIKGTDGIGYFVSEDINQTNEDYRNAENYTYSSLATVDYENLCGKEVVVYAGLISTESTPRVLEYKKLGTVHISNDQKPPKITSEDLKVWDSTAAQFVAEDLEKYTDDNNIYYGNSEKYLYTVNVADEGETGDIAGVNWPTLNVSLEYSDGTFTNMEEGNSLAEGKYTLDKTTGKLQIVLTKTQVEKATKIRVTVEDNKQNAAEFVSPYSIKQAISGTTIVSVAFADGTAWSDTSQSITIGKLESAKQLVVTLKSTEEIAKVTLQDGWEGVPDTEKSIDGKDRTHQTVWTFTVPKNAKLSVSEKLEGLEVKAYKADNSEAAITGTSTLGDIIYDVEAPKITSVKLQKSRDAGASWEDVDTTQQPVVTELNLTTGVDFGYRYVVTVTDAGESGIDKVVIGGNEATANSGDEYIWPISVSSLNADELYTPTVYATDKAGNVCDSQQLPSLKKINDTLKYDSVQVTDANGTVVGNQDLNIQTNKQYKLSVKVSSAYPFTSISLYGTEGKIQDYAAGGSGSSGADNRYTVTHTFDLPEGTDNAKLSAMYLQTVDTRQIATSVRFPADSNKFIGDILYDRTNPVFTLQSALDPNKWYNEYQLAYAIATGDGTQTVESEFASATYTLQNGVNTTGTPVSLEPNGKTVSGKITIPQSVSPAGTTITFTAKDECENSFVTNPSYTIKVDGEAPKITKFDVNGKTAFSAPVEGNVVICANVADNLTIESSTIQIVGPDGINVTKTLCETGERVNIEKNNSFTLNDFIGRQAPDGDYEVTVKASDKAGNKAVDRKITFKVDNTIPVVTAKISDGVTAGKQPGKNFDGTDCDYFYRSNVTALLTYEDDNLAQSKVVVKDNGTTVPVQWSRVGTTNKYQATYVASKEGAHTITIGATDEAGNAAVTKQIVFIKDTAAPAITAVINGGMVYNENMGVVDLTANANVSFSVSDSNEDVKDFNYQLIKTEPDQLPVTADVIQTETRGFGYVDEADYIVKVYAIDKAGNKSAERTVQFRVDKTAPELKISGASSGATLNSGTTLTFSMTEAFWKDASGTVTITRKPKDGAQESTYKTIDFKPTARTTTMTETLSETGEYKVTFTGKDRAGHSAEAASYTVKIDTGKPVIALSGVKNNDKTTDAVEFTAQIDEDFYLTKSVSIKATRTYLDKTSYQEKTEDLQITGYNPAAATTLIRNIFTEDGIYKIQIDCKDAAGNADTQEVSFTIDKTKPVIDAKVLAAYAGKLTAFSWDYDLDDIIYDLTVCDVHMYLNGTEYDGTSEVEDGAYELKIVAEDELGNQTEETSNFSLDTKAPTFIVTGVEDGEVKNEQYDINVSLQLEEDTLDSVSLNGKAIEIKDDAASITVTEKGDYKLTMKAHDEAGNEAEKTISFTYGEKKSVVLYVVIGVAALAVLGGGGAALVIGLRKKKA